MHSHECVCVSVHVSVSCPGVCLLCECEQGSVRGPGVGEGGFPACLLGQPAELELGIWNYTQ